MTEEHYAHTHLQDNIEEPVRGPTSESRVQPRCYPDQGSHVIQRSDHNSENRPIVRPYDCYCLTQETDDAEYEKGGDKSLSASREEVIIGLEECHVESTVEVGEQLVEVGEHWRGSVCDYPYYKEVGLILRLNNLHVGGNS